MGAIRRKKHLSRTAVTLGLAFGVVIGLYALVFVYPSYRSVCRTRQTIVENTAKLEQLKALYPVFVRSKTLDRIRFEHRLPFPERVRIPRDALSKVSAEIMGAAGRNQMTLSGSDFDVNSLKNESQSVSMTLELKGELFDFRRFLIDIIAFEFFDSIENLSVRSNKEQMKNFTVNLNIRIKKNRS